MAEHRGRPRSDEAYQNILHAAYEMLMEVGFTQLTIEGVAARALVGKPTITSWLSPHRKDCTQVIKKGIERA